MVLTVTMQVPLAGIVSPERVALPLVAGNVVSTTDPPQLVVTEAIVKSCPEEAVIGKPTPVSVAAVGLLIVNVWVFVFPISTVALPDAVTPIAAGMTCNVCDAPLVFAPRLVTSAPGAIVLMPLPTTAPTTLNEMVHVPGTVELTATGIVPLLIEMTVPAIVGVPPAQVVARPLGVAIAAWPPMVAMSSVNDVIVAALTVEVFSSATVTVET
jgi:hypothetical protein